VPTERPTTDDSSFLGTGAAAELYEQHLVPLTFAEHSRAMASRFQEMAAGRLLEIAAGTGALTRELRKLLPDAVEIVATDLNQPMLDQAKAVPEAGLITWQQADVMALPFEDASFNAAVCQFGVMFLPDKVAGFSQVHRVLRPGGWFRFSVWDRMRANILNQMYQDVIDAMFPTDPPGRMLVPFSYYDQAIIDVDLTGAGFIGITFEPAPGYYRATSAREAAYAITQGHPVRQEVEARGREYLERAAETLAKDVAARYGLGPVAIPNQAIIVTAQRPVP
jgi:SAM-dependent methyltransferase